MANFKEATAVKQTGPGEFSVVLDGQWSVGKKLHGSYLLAGCRTSRGGGRLGALGHHEVRPAGAPELGDASETNPCLKVEPPGIAGQRQQGYLG